MNPILNRFFVSLLFLALALGFVVVLFAFSCSGKFSLFSVGSALVSFYLDRYIFVALLDKLSLIPF